MLRRALFLTFICNIINIPTVNFFVTCNGPAYSCCGGNWTEPSTRVIAHGVGMTPTHLVWVSSSNMIWYGPKPLDTMVDTRHVKLFIRKRVFPTWYECT